MQLEQHALHDRRQILVVGAANIHCPSVRALLLRFFALPQSSSAVAKPQSECRRRHGVAARLRLGNRTMQGEMWRAVTKMAPEVLEAGRPVLVI